MKRIVLAISLLFLLPILFTIAQQSAEKKQIQEREQILKMLSTVEKSQHVLFTGKVKHQPTSEVEKFFREEMMPIIARSHDVLDLKTYANIIGGDSTYVVLLEIKHGVPLSFDTVFEVFSNGYPPEQAFKTINHFANFFETSSTSVILYRPDLSISRGYAGVFKPEKIKEEFK